MVATAPSVPAGPPTQGRSASRIASDGRGATEVALENAVLSHLVRRRPAHTGATCLGRARPHRRDAHWERRRFSGQTRSGRYSWARYYHPQLQRFISEDPIGFESGDPNHYAYVASGPLTRRDPLGLQAIPIPAPAPIPIPLPPVFVPGTPENDAFARATGNALQAGAAAISAILTSMARKCGPPEGPCSCVCYRAGTGPNAIGQQPNPRACRAACRQMAYDGYKCGGSTVRWD
jgi:RHS repeat-associated protein